MYFWANSRCRIENSVEIAAVFLHPLYIIRFKIVPRAYIILDIWGSFLVKKLLHEQLFNLQAKFFSTKAAECYNDTVSLGVKKIIIKLSSRYEVRKFAIKGSTWNFSCDSR